MINVHPAAGPVTGGSAVRVRVAGAAAALPLRCAFGRATSVPAVHDSFHPGTYICVAPSASMAAPGFNYSADSAESANAQLGAAVAPSGLEEQEEADVADELTVALDGGVVGVSVRVVQPGRHEGIVVDTLETAAAAAALYANDTKSADLVRVTRLISRARVVSVWFAPRRAAAFGIAYTYDDGRFDWVSSSLEQTYAHVVTFDPPRELNVSTLHTLGGGASRLLLLKVLPRAYGAPLDDNGGALAPRAFAFFRAPTLSSAAPLSGPAEGAHLFQCVAAGLPRCETRLPVVPATAAALPRHQHRH